VKFGEFLRCRLGFDVNSCVDQIEATEHMFYDCKFAYTFWEDLHYWLFPKCEGLPVQTHKNVIFFIYLFFS